MTILEPLIAGRGGPEALIGEARDLQRRRRRRSVLAIVLVAGVGAIGYGVDRSGSSGAGAARDPGAAARTLLYGFAGSYAAPSTLARVNPKTLQLVGERLRVPRDFSPGALAPDGTHVLLLNHTNRGEPTLSIVDLTTLRIESALQPRLDAALGRGRAVTAVWPAADRLLVVAQRLGRARWRRGPRVVVAQTLIAINPSTGAVQWKRDLGAKLLPTDQGTIGGTAVFVLQSGRSAQRGQAAVMTVSPSGSLHSSLIAVPAAGYGIRIARLVVTAGDSGSHAYVLTGGGTIYSVDPLTARTTRHVVPTPGNAPATSPPDLILSGSPLGDNIVVSSFFPRPAGPPAAGVYLIDPASWTARLLDPTTPAWLTSGTSLLTFTQAGQFRLPSSWRSKGTGITIYDESGAVRRHLYGTQAFATVTTTPGFAAAVLPSPPDRTTQPHTPAQYRAREATTTLHELLFNASTGRTLGSRTVIGQPPALIRPPATSPHR